MLFVAADHFLKEHGRLGFVITQTIFKSAGGGKGFRRLRLGGDSFLQIARVSDFSACQPFEGAANRTAVVALSVGKSPNQFPVNYRVFSPTSHRPPAEMSASDAERFFKITDLQAFPLTEESGASWITLKPGMYEVFEKIHGKTDYRARIGAHSGGAAGVFWVDALEWKNRGVLIRNLHDAGRNKFPQISKIVEADLVRPLLRGKDVDRWSCFSRHHIVLPYLPINGGKALSESVLKRQFPKTYEYFQTFRERLIDRPHYRQHFAPSGQPYWSLYNVGDYTFAPHRIVWREQSADFKCCVVPEAPEGVYVADAKLIVVACASNDEAHFLAACLNSSPARFLIQSYTIEVQVSTHVLSHVAVPSFDGGSLHRELAEKSRLCHVAAAKADKSALAVLENEIDELTAQLWKIDSKEATIIKKSLASMVGKTRDRASKGKPAELSSAQEEE
jgi:hypothetical protein